MDNLITTMFFVLVIGIFAYVSGSIIWAVIAAKISGKDIRKLGTKNPGMANTTRELGVKYGSLVLIGDILTAFFALSLVKYLFQNIFDFHPIIFLVFITVFLLGTFFPVFHRFKGGSGLAKLLGIALTLNPIGFLLNAPLAILFLFKIRNADWKFVGPALYLVIVTILLGSFFKYSYHGLGLQYIFPDFWGVLCLVFLSLLVLIKSEYHDPFFTKFLKWFKM